MRAGAREGSLNLFMIAVYRFLLTLSKLRSLAKIETEDWETTVGRPFTLPLDLAVSFCSIRKSLLTLTLVLLLLLRDFSGLDEVKCCFLALRALI